MELNANTLTNDQAACVIPNLRQSLTMIHMVDKKIVFIVTSITS